MSFPGTQEVPSLHKKNILKKTMQVGSSTLMSRFLGLAREILLMRFLGVGVIADAFTTAFLIPNSLRKIFAEGALTAAFVPTFIALFHKGGKEKANQLMGLAFLLFEGIVLLLCILVTWQPEATIHMIAPGFSPEQVIATIPCLRILMPFIFFISSSSLLAGALQSVNHFFIPAFCPVLLNIFFIGGIVLCLAYNFSVAFLCYAILMGGLIQFLAHLIQYLYLGFYVSYAESDTIKTFGSMIIKFLFCFLSMSVMELSLIIDQRFASYLPVGSVTLIKYTSRFMGIPLGVFAVAFSTILLPHFARTHLSDPKRLHFYLNESMKFVFWVTIPATIIMGYLSEDIFITLFASSSSKFPQALIPEAGYLLMTFLSGLFFFSINKILFNLYYSFHDTKLPTIIAALATIINIISNYALVGRYGTIGLAAGTCLSGAAQTLLSLYFLKRTHEFDLHLKDFFNFVRSYSLQLAIVFIPFYWIYKLCLHSVSSLCSGSTKLTFFFLKSFGFWLWVMPLMIALFVCLYLVHKKSKTVLYFLD